MGHIFTIEAVLGSQHIAISAAFWKSLFARFVKKFWAHFPDFCISKQSCLPLSSDACFELSASKVYKNVLGAISRVVHPKTKRFAVKFRRILEVLCFARFVKKVLEACSRFFCRKVKLFAVAFRCILDVLRLQGLQ